MDNRYVIGIDLGGTNARAVLADSEGCLLEEALAHSESAGPPNYTFDVLGRLVEQIMAARQVSAEETAGIGIGLPGIITADGRCVWSPNFPLWHDVPVKIMLEGRTNLPCYFMNDARCATLAELRLGAGRGIDNMVFVGLGTGIGGGIVVDGQLLLGRNGSIGEIAHHTIDPAGPRCGCGNFGCWEAFCGRDAIVNRALRKLQSGRLSSLSCDGRSATPAAIAAEALSGDIVAREVMEEVGCYLGIGIANLINMLNPQRVVVGGGVARAEALLFEPMRRTVLARAVSFQASDCEIVPAQLGSDAGVRGAVCLAVQRVAEAI